MEGMYRTVVHEGGCDEEERSWFRTVNLETVDKGLITRRNGCGPRRDTGGSVGVSKLRRCRPSGVERSSGVRRPSGVGGSAASHAGVTGRIVASVAGIGQQES